MIKLIKNLLSKKVPTSRNLNEADRRLILNWIIADHDWTSTKKSYELLLEHLPLEEVKRLRHSREICVTGNYTKTQYTISVDVALSQVRCDSFYNTRRSKRFCLMAPFVPYFDEILAQYLLIRYDEMTFLRQANYVAKYTLLREMDGHATVPQPC